jgi:hypothetical protein
MTSNRVSILTIVALGCGMAFSAGVSAASPAVASQQQPAPGSAAVAKRLGTIKSINGNTVTLAPDSGPEIIANVQPTARILRLASGEKDLKNATPIQLKDLQVGDTIRVRGFASEDGKSIATLEILVITRSVVAAVTDQIRQDWQKRGVGGLVSGVDPATGTITISLTGVTGKKTIAVHAAKNTVVRRYAPDSTKFEDAKPSTLDQVQPGDQLRARGDRNGDGTELTAEEIVSGSFRNIAGTVNSVDVGAGTLTIQDLLSKKAVQVKITSDSQLHQLPAEMAQRIAMRLKASMAGAMPPGMPGAATGPTRQNAQAGAATPASSGGMNPNGGGAGTGGMGGGGMGGGMRGGGATDFAQVLSRMPAVALADLHRGDAVMMVATQGSAAGVSTAITLLSGVEPILQAAPNASQAMMLTPWSLGGGPGGDAGNQ